jgi:hypothetical protein
VASRGWAGRVRVAVTLALAGAGLAAAGGAAPALAAGPAWSVTPAPNHAGPSNGSLNAVSCVSASQCFAVGSSAGAVASANATATLIESWKGTKWSTMQSPTESTDSALEGLSCVSASFCMAVGQYTITVAGAIEPVPRTLIESWNGSKWSIVPSPTPATSTSLSLEAVSCTSATACMAVGQSFDNGSGIDTLMESWNGSKWSIVPSPNPAGAEVQTFGGVSCTSATACMAVGSSNTNDIISTLAESWNGSTWSIVASPDKNLDTNILTGVSCVSATSCTAVGYYVGTAGGTLIESWNGSTWSIVPTSFSGHNLNGVSCASVTSCTAVGDQYVRVDETDVQATVVETWNGSEWSSKPSPNRGTSNDNALAGVSCFSASVCVAVGSEYTPAPDYSADLLRTLAESWQSGKWSVLSTPNPVTDQNALNSVSCVSASFCVAVGFFQDSEMVDQALVESWNGSKWSIVPSPDEAGNNQLNGVSCLSSTFCVAAGTYKNDTLFEFWNGTKWSVVSSPNVGGDTNNNLSSVSCVSATSCMAVGDALVGGVGEEALTESWNGSKWSIVSSPDGAEYLTGVSCVSVTSCTAAGWYNTGEGSDQTEIQSWNGSAWSLVSSPDQGTGNNTLAGISCPSAASCTAVGNYVNTSGVSQTLVESWNGSAWSLVSSPDRGSGNNTLAGISCPSAASCTAVGNYVNTSGVSQTLVESWNGSAWSIAPSPNQSNGQNQLLAVSCATTTSCAAVGDEADSTGSQFNLAELFG